MQTYSSQENWTLTLIRISGLRLLRPEKSWRPIVSILIDEHEIHETVMGCDGQNPNLKACFPLREADASSRVLMKVWQKSQSKKKGKKRNLVASVAITLDQLLKKQGSDNYVDVRLNSQSSQKPSPASKGKPQNGAHLIVKVCPPTSVRPSFRASSDQEIDYLSDAMSSTHGLSDTLTSTPSLIEEDLEQSTPEDDLHDIVPPTKLRKRRRPVGYSLFSDDERSVDGDDDYLSEVFEEIYSQEIEEIFIQEDTHDIYFDPILSLRPEHKQYLSPGPLIQWIAASYLPSHSVDQSSVASTMTVAESALDTITGYRELREASLDCDFERILAKLQSEWTYVGASLLALAGLDATVFGIAPGSTLFDIDSVARRAIAVGSMASGIGIALDAWFLLRYTGTDIQKFQSRAQDVYGTYFFFCLTSRLPALCMFVSAFSLMVFLSCVAWSAWPTAVMVMCFCFGVLISLQYTIYGAHRLFRGLIELSKMVRRFLVGAVAKVRGVPGFESDSVTVGEENLPATVPQAHLRS